MAITNVYPLSDLPDEATNLIFLPLTEPFELGDPAPAVGAICTGHLKLELPLLLERVSFW